MMVKMGQLARAAASKLAYASTEQKNAALLHLADRLSAHMDQVLTTNQEEVKQGMSAGLSESLLDRLRLNPTRIGALVSDLRNLASLPDPVGEIFDSNTLPNGLKVYKQRVPLGVIGVIYEARPNVTLDVAALAIKTGNAVILRGGRETIQTNRVLVSIIRDALVETGLPADVVQFVDDPDRALVGELLQLYDYVDMIIPRGGAGLHKFCRENSRIPVITGGIGICHLFVDRSADLEAALKVIQNAKVQRPTVCNALDTALIHHSIAAEFLPQLVAHLEPDGVSFRADETALAILSQQPSKTQVVQKSTVKAEPPALTPQTKSNLPDSVQAAKPDDFNTEWLSLVLGLKVVENLDQAIEHIASHSTGHSDGILTRDEANAHRFVQEVDSAAVYVNASTRFTDGAQLGLGAEVAISTQRLHARGPMGLKELTTYKWVIQGENHIRV
jgi:glutamate-5-semialdehyde dehydrogenase